MKCIFLGGQGSGKSTQAQLLSKKLGILHLEMGQLLRDRAQIPDEIGSTIKKELDKGNLVPDETTINILKEKSRGKSAEKGYVLDGYPRNKTQLDALDKDIDKVFYINVSDKEAIRRLSKRGRSDDTGKALSKRLEIYHNQTEPLLESFKNAGLLEEVDGERSIQEIHEDILRRLNI